MEKDYLSELGEDIENAYYKKHPEELEKRKQEARYYQDKATLDNQVKPPYLCTVDDLLIFNVLPENYQRWYKEKILKPEEIFKPQGQVKFYIQEQPIFYDENGMWWIWDRKEIRWKITDEVNILNHIEAITGKDIITPKNRTLLLNSLKQECRKSVPLKVKPTWIQFQEEIIDIITGEKFKSIPDYFITNPIPYKISGNPNTPVMDKIFKEWVGENRIETLYEIIAYCLIADYPINRLFCFIGEGLNGKSCFLNLLKKFVGETNVCSTELDTLLNSRFEVTRLHKKLVCIMGETNFAEMSKTSILKKLTGGDYIGFEYKNKTPFHDYNYAKILIATNNLPATTDKTIGFYRRWLIIDFVNRFSEKKDILLEIPDEEYNNLATKCVIILNGLLTKRSFTNEGSVEERMKRFEEKSNPLDKFVKEFCSLEDPNGFITSNQFEKKFNEWCKENRFRNFSSESIARGLKNLNIEHGRSYIDWWENDIQTRKQVKGWMGIKWKE